MLENPYTKEDYRQLAQLPLSRKIQIAQTRILEAFIKAEQAGKECAVSFSGGIDSTILLDLVRRVKPECKAVYFDTGMEIPIVKEFALSFENVEIAKPQYCETCTNCSIGCFGRVNMEYGFVYPNKGDVCLNQASYERQMREGKEKKSQHTKKILNEQQFLLEQYGIKTSPKCCTVLKKDVAKRYVKRHDIFAMFIGVKAFESLHRYMSWRNNGCNNFEKNASRPISIWNNQDNFEYIKTFNLPYCKEWYGEIIPNKSGGFKWSKHQRSGCYGCPISFTEKETDEVQEIKQNYPEMYEQLCKIKRYIELYDYTKEGRKAFDINI